MSGVGAPNLGALGVTGVTGVTREEPVRPDGCRPAPDPPDAALVVFVRRAVIRRPAGGRYGLSRSAVSDVRGSSAPARTGGGRQEI